MKIFGLEFRRASKAETSSVIARSSGAGGLFLGSREKPMLLSAVYRCVDVIGDSVAQLPLLTYNVDYKGYKTPHKNHPAFEVLNSEPNEDMTRFTFFKTLVTSVLLRGNGYAYIERDDKNQVSQLIYLPDTAVAVVFIRDEQGIERKRYRVTGFKNYVEPQDMIHVLNFSYDGILGVSTLTHARQTLNIATQSEEHAAGFFANGGSTSGTLTIEGKLTKEQKEQNYREWERRLNPVTGHPNGIVILEGHMKYQPITVNPKDAQLLESRMFNVVDICRFFSVSPVKVFDLSKSSYSTVEATQIGFLTDTLAPILEKIELELRRKVFLPRERKNIEVKFDISVILRADKAAQASYLNKLFQIGCITPNEVRKSVDMPPIDGGDTTFVQVNAQPLLNALLPKE